MQLRLKKSGSRLRLAFGALALLFLLLPGAAHAQTRPQSPVPLPVPFTPIVDNANVIDAATRERLESIYRNLKERSNIEYAVLTVPTTGDQDIFDFSLAVARGWGIGPKGGAEKPGLLLVVAIQDRKYFTQVSDHLEGDLPDGLVGFIQRERLVPAFRQQRYSEGIFNTIQAYVATLAQKRGFSVEGIDQNFAYRQDQPERAREGSRSSLTITCCGALVVLGILIALSIGSRGGPRGGGRRRRGWDGGTWLTALLLANLASGLSSGGRSSGSSGWGGGFGGGGFGGGGGGGFGGGFGGGGSFGGGGAGGSW